MQNLPYNPNTDLPTVQNLPYDLNSGPPRSTLYPVRYADGVVTIAETDLHSDGFGFPWGQTRSWTNGPGYATGSDNGSGWVDTYIPHLIQADGSTNYTLIFIANGNTAFYYDDLVNGAYQPRINDGSQLTYNSTNDTYTLTDTLGDQIVLDGFGSSWLTAQKGQFAKFISPGGETMAVTSYTTDGHVTEEVVAGDGDSQTGGGLGTYTFRYTASSNTPGYNNWNTKTVVTNPDGSTDTVYTNYFGEVMLDDHYDPSSGLHTDSFYAYNTNAQLVLAAAPSAVSGYNDTYADLLDNVNGQYQYLNNSSGLITRYDYYTTTTATETAAGSVANYLEDAQIQQGQTGTLIPQETWQYFAHAYNGQTIAPIATDTVYGGTGGGDPRTTSYAFTWFTNTAQVQSETDTAPVISASQNGPGTADVTTIYYDQYGNTQWIKDPDGFIQYYAYDPVTGGLLKAIVDVNTADTSEFTNLPSGWSTPSGGGLNLVTQYQVDALGRTTEETSPAGNITYYVYLDPQHEERIYRGWNSCTGTPAEPTEVYREDTSGTYTEVLTMTATPSLNANGTPNGTEAISGLQTLTRDYTNAAGQVTSEYAYYNLGGLAYSTGMMGSVNVNYYQTNYGYDNWGRLVRTLSYSKNELL